jgi:hypothetical protein
VAKRRKPAPLHLDVLGTVRAALRSLRRVERFLTAQERRSVQRGGLSTREARVALTAKGREVLSAADLGQQA